MSAKETIPFQAETRELLDLVIHSLYTHKEIFLRELISNASDAIDRYRHEALSAGAGVDSAGLRIRLEVDPERGVLEIDDNGVGMTREELVGSIGTIASSGTRRFLEALKERHAGGEGLAELPSLIGQFGVGFYSAFMVADEVEVETKRRGEEQGVRWVSRGKGDYTLEEIDKQEPGTTVVLHLSPPDADDEKARDFTQPWVLREVVKKYSDFIEYPIELEGEEGKVDVLNSMKPLWTRPKADIEDEEYAEFYKHISHDWNEPLETIHFQAQGTAEYSALLYVPKQRPFELFDPQQARSRVHLYVKRIFIMEDCEELMPPWLRFVRGVVDSADLPLNVSRETLQHNRQMGQIRKRLTRKIVDTLQSLLAERREDYQAFWSAFGPVVKEGIYYDEELREEVAKLALFDGTGDGKTTLSEYVERMPVKQKAIYVLLAEEVEAARQSPHLEAFRAQGYEVLFLTDAVDEFVLQRMSEFDGKKLERVDRGEVDLDDDADDAERAGREKELEPVLEAVRNELAEDVSEVRFSRRLRESAACLVADEGELSPHMRRVLKEQGREVPPQKDVLELNASHPIARRLQELAGDEQHYARFAEACEVVLGSARVSAGGTPKDPGRFARLVADLIAR